MNFTTTQKLQICFLSVIIAISFVVFSSLLSQKVSDQEAEVINAMPSPKQITPTQSTVVTLQIGSHDVAVSVLQRILVKDGYLTSVQVTGNFDTATEAAVEQLQLSQDQTQTGIYAIKKSNLASFFASVPATFTSIKYGNSGSRTSSLQNFLIKGNYLGASQSDGRFGAITQKALKTFQKAHNLPQTGIVDTATFDAMNGK
jgi:peptidoglycan hydrolase-like protein with peptidoglycan-binding domain